MNIKLNDRKHIPNIERISMFSNIFIHRSTVDDVIKTPHDLSLIHI